MEKIKFSSTRVRDIDWRGEAYKLEQEGNTVINIQRFGDDTIIYYKYKEEI